MADISRPADRAVDEAFRIASTFDAAFIALTRRLDGYRFKRDDFARHRAADLLTELLRGADTPENRMLYHIHANLDRYEVWANFDRVAQLLRTDLDPVDNEAAMRHARRVCEYLVESIEELYEGGKLQLA